MVLEYILSPKEAKRKPWELIAVSFLFVSFGVLTQLLIPSLEGSVIIFAMVPLIPLFFVVLAGEESAEARFSKLKTEVDSWKKVLKALKQDEKPALFPFALAHRFKRVVNVHKDLIELFGFLFIGAVIAYAFWFSVLPQEVSYNLFYPQLQELKTIRSTITANVFSDNLFQYLLSHNLQVLLLMLLFSVIYGIGALYLLLWNASIIGVVLGERMIQQGLAGTVVGLLGLIPHGIFEISSYFIGAIAGGILSIAIMKSAYKKPFFKYLVEDVVLLAGMAFLLLLVGAFIEASY
ncbi:MAG: stage II sporulation protein M [Candidatus Micrarchaeota archaeon]